MEKHIKCHFPDVGIKSIKDLTKEELIELVDYSYTLGNTYLFDDAILRIVDRRLEKKRADKDAKFERWSRLVDEYKKLTQPYNGKRVSEVPPDVLHRCAELERKIERASAALTAIYK